MPATCCSTAGGRMAMMMGRGGMMGGGKGGAGFHGYGLAQQQRIWACASVARAGYDHMGGVSAKRRAVGECQHHRARTLDDK